MATSALFEQLYNGLNTAQKKAVDTIDGPVMVVAGPGTGKTTILTLRIANILRLTDTNPEQILALTFTESGVNSMRKKLSLIIGSSAYRVNINTFHGFSNEVISLYPDEFPRIIGSVAATEIDRIKIIEKIVDLGSYVLLRPYGDTRYYVKHILNAIKTLKRDNISPEEFLTLTEEEKSKFESIGDLYHKSGAYKGKMRGKYSRQEKYILKNEELSRIYKKYEEELQIANIYDFEDMIVEVVKKMASDSQFLLMLQEEYQYILADEHQDANNAQNKILELLSSFFDKPNLFIVGDEKQAIFRFQGASLQNFLYFRDKYPDVTLIALSKNYRSTQKILDASHSMITYGNGKNDTLRQRLTTNKTLLEKNIELHSLSRPVFEYMYIADNIEKLIDQGVEPREIAVLYRDNKDVIELARYLQKTDIPFQIESDIGLLNDEDIRKLIIILNAILSPEDEGWLIKMLSIDFFNIHHTDLYKLIKYSSDNKIKLFNLLNSKKAIRSSGVNGPDTFYKFYKLFSSWVSVSRNKLLLPTLEIIIRESGFLSNILSKEGSVSRIDTLDTFLSEAEKATLGNDQFTLSDFIKYLEVLDEYNIMLKKREVLIKDGVRLMTAHRSKGLEFDYVFIIGVWHGHWGGRRSIRQFTLSSDKVSLSSSGDDSDERRLFYVAITRAREGVYISYSTTSADGRVRLPSQFISEIDSTLIDERTLLESEPIYTKRLKEQYKPQKISAPSVYDKEYLNKLFLEQGLAVTSINNYLICPWRYFYNNLIRIPKPQSKFQIYGVVIHRVLKEIFEKVSKDKKVTKTALLSRYKVILSDYTLSDIDFRELLQKGKKALSGYYDKYSRIWYKNVLTEFKIDGINLELKHKNKNIKIPIKGKLDKIQIYDDEVVVVDYKTGKQRSRNAIEGKTAGSIGEYKRQLVFYKLLLGLFEDGKYKMKSAVIDFIEPDSKGRYKTEKFIITDDEVGELKKDTLRIAGEILDLSFWNKVCEDKKCEFCKLRELTLKS